MSRAGAISGAVVAALAIPAVAAAKPSGDLVSELREAGAAEAPIVVRVEARGLAAILGLVRARVPSFLRGGLDGGIDQLASQLGGSPFSDDGWRALGLDPARPVVIAIGRTNQRSILDPAAHAATDAILTDVRVIVPIADAARAQQAIARAQAIAPALVFGAPGRTLSIDLVIPAAADTDDEVRRATPALLAARSTAAAVDARLRDPSAAALAGPAPIAIHVVPRALVDAMLWRRVGLQFATPSSDTVGFARELARPLAAILDGPLGPLGAAIDVQAGTLSVRATWAVAPRSPLARALAHTIDSGLPRPSDTPDAALHVHSYLADVDVLTALPPGGMTFDLPSAPFFPYGGLSPVIDVLAWPYALGATIRHVVAADARAAPIFAGVRDAVLIVSSIGADVDHSAAAVEVSLTDDAATRVRGLVDAVWGASATAAGVTTWGAGPIRAFARTVGTTATIGASLRDTLPAHLAFARAAPPAPPALVLEVHATPAALASVTPLAVFAGTLDLAACWDGHALAIDATLSPP